MLSVLSRRTIVSNPWMIFLSTAFVVSLAVIDSGVINVALPILSHYFDVNFQIIQWLITAYLFAVCLMIPIAGRLSDVFSSRQTYLFGIAVFIIGSFLCSIATQIHEFIFFRVIQGIGASFLLANTQAILMHTFPKALRGRALGINSMIVACGAIVGPSLGGFLIQFLGWRSIFYINIPIGLLGYLGTFIYLKQDEKTTKEQIDFSGMGLFAISLLLFLGLLSHEELWQAGYITYLFVILFFVFSALFIKRELTALMPFIALSLFRICSFLFGTVNMFFVNLIFMINSILLPYYLMSVKLFYPAIVGLFLLISPLFVGAFAPLSGYVGDRTQRFILLQQVGVIGFIIALSLISLYNLHTSILFIVISQSLLGIAMGIYLSPNNYLTFSDVSFTKIGVASGLAAFSRNFGRIIGVTLCSAVLQIVRAMLFKNATGQLVHYPEVIVLSNKVLMILSIVFSVVILFLSSVNTAVKKRI
ncbi:MAG: MFS transporter [Pseudomonadota bacterium]